MKITKEHVGKVFTVEDVPQSEPCLNCTPCLRLRIMEMGMIPGEKIELEKHHLGLWTVNILTDNNNISSTIAMRDEEMERIFVESERCGLSIV
jgi:Fe2+ transport system protein FeoA